MNKFQNVIIISAELKELGKSDNAYRSFNLHDCLNDTGIKFEPARGGYKGQLEICFVCVPKDLAEIEMLKDLAFKSFNQGSVLEQDSSGMSWLVTKDGSSEKLGKLRQVKSEVGLSNYNIMNGNVYTTEL